MKLYNRTHNDYYDGTLLSLYRDSGLVFDRKERIEYVDFKKMRIQYGYALGPWQWGDLCKEWPFGKVVGTGSGWHNGNDGIRQLKRLYFIGFCGEVYPVLRTSYLDERDLIDYDNPYDNPYAYRLKSKNREQFFSNPPKNFQDYWQEMMEKNRSPIFVASPSEQTIAWNANLDEFGFYKIVDPYQASQRIYQFFSNLGSLEKDIPEIDDMTKIEIHGFDTKTSFRKSKEK